MLDVRNYPFISNVDRDELLKKIRDENLKTVTIAGGRREWRNTIKEGKMKVKEKKNGKRGTEETGKLRGPSRIFTSHSRNGSR